MPAQSVLLDYAQKKNNLRALQEEIARMESDPKLSAATRFEEEAKALIETYDLSRDEVIGILYPELAPLLQEHAATNSTRTRRRQKRFTHPLTGKQVIARGSNNKQLKAWKEEHGEEEVNSWGEYID